MMMQAGAGCRSNLDRLARMTETETSTTATNDLAIRRALDVAGVEFTNGDQPGVRLTKAAAVRSAEAAAASKPAAKAVRGQATNAPKKR